MVNGMALRDDMLYGLACGHGIWYGLAGMVWYIVWSGGHSMVYGMAWWASHAVCKAWRGMAWYVEMLM